MVINLIHSLSPVLKLRILSALIGIPFCLGCLWVGSPLLDLLIIACAGYSLYEWASLTGQTSSEFKILALASCFSLGGYYINLPYIFFIFFLSFSLFIFYYLHSEKISRSSFLLSTGFFYLITAFISLLHLAYMGKRNLIFLLLLIVWSADTGAYFCGRFFGGAKLAPSISPSKTWSGFMGGTLLALLICYIAAPYLNHGSSFYIYLCLILSSHFGDLLESAIKRYYNVKDSGNLIPGHGGLLDRLDSLLLITLTATLIFL